MQNFRDIKVWQKSHELVLRIYSLSAGFPSEEKFGLVSQLRRAAVSIPANIAEGSRRIGRNDYARFLNIAEASLAETEYLLILARDLRYIVAQNSLEEETRELEVMLHALRTAVEARA